MKEYLKNISHRLLHSLPGYFILAIISAFVIAFIIPGMDEKIRSGIKGLVSGQEITHDNQEEINQNLIEIKSLMRSLSEENIKENNELFANIDGTGTSLRDPKFGVLYVEKNDEGYVDSEVTVKEGDVITFNVHYYANGGDLTNVKAYMGDRSGTIVDGSKTFSAYVDASNASIVNDSVIIKSNSKVKLVFDGSSLQLNSCRSKSCQVASGYKNSYTIQHVPKNEYGNALFAYRVVSIE